MGLKTIDAATLKQWLEKDEAVLVDVREPGEHAAQSIAGAKLIPLSGVCKKALPDCTGKKLVVHCMKGGRGNTACAKLLAEDPSLEIYNLEGGISAWCEAGLGVNKTSKGCFLPLDRQVQLTIGLGVLIGSLLAYTVSPAFMLLTGFFGAGLTVAGITGFCGLALLMAKMPWNQRA
jgi:rhodanese-related sulfurtransferase